MIIFKAILLREVCFISYEIGRRLVSSENVGKGLGWRELRRELSQVPSYQTSFWKREGIYGMKWPLITFVQIASFLYMVTGEKFIKNPKITLLTALIWVVFYTHVVEARKIDEEKEREKEKQVKIEVQKYNESHQFYRQLN